MQSYFEVLVKLVSRIRFAYPTQLRQARLQATSAGILAKGEIFLRWSKSSYQLFNFKMLDIALDVRYFVIFGVENTIYLSRRNTQNKQLKKLFAFSLKN